MEIMGDTDKSDADQADPCHDAHAAFGAAGAPAGGSGGAGAITDGDCSCECDYRQFADELCELFCEEEFAACDSR